MTTLSQESNHLLKELYEKEYSNYVSRYKEFCSLNNISEKRADPLLLQIDETYQNADIKVMILGQETNKWCNEKPGQFSISQIRSTYINHLNSHRAKSRSAFFRGSNLFIKLLSNNFPKKKIQYVWNNIVKIGKPNCKGFPGFELYDFEKKYLNIIKTEVEILKPDVLLFLTGYTYDRFIKDKFEEVAFSNIDGFETKKLCKLIMPSVEFAFRTYHPNYLFFHKSAVSYFKTVIENIKL